MGEQTHPEQSDTPEAIRLVNADNGRVITQLTRNDLEALRFDTTDEALSDKLGLFVAWMDGKRRARLGTRSRRT